MGDREPVQTMVLALKVAAGLSALAVAVVERLTVTAQHTADIAASGASYVALLKAVEVCCGQ